MDAFASAEFPIIVSSRDNYVEVSTKSNFGSDGKEISKIYEVHARRADGTDALRATFSQRDVALDIFVHTFQAMLSVGL